MRTSPAKRSYSRGLGLGPVFEFEWRIGARRFRTYAFRSCFVMALLAALLIVWYAEMSDGVPSTARAQARIGESFFIAIVGTQLAMTMLAAGAATAGAVCLEKARGTLAHVLTTDVTSSEIVLGKLAARLAAVWTLVLCTQPVMALASLLGGIDPWALTGATLISLGLGAFSCSLALLLSVWGKKTHEVLLMTYVVLLFWVIGGPALWLTRFTLGWRWALPDALDWLPRTSPYWLALAPSIFPGTVSFGDHVVFMIVTLVFAGVLAAVAVHRLRPVAVNQFGGQPAKRAGRLGSILRHVRLPNFPGPELDPNPVLWREWHRRRPTGWTRLIWLGYGAMVIAITVSQIQLLLTTSGARTGISFIMSGGEVALGLILFSVTAATSLSEERVRGSLDVLLATPMSTAAIVWGKWWGAFRGAILLAIPPTIAVTFAALPVFHPEVIVLQFLLLLAYGAALTSLGLAAGTWFPNPGRASAVTIAAVLIMTVGWFMLAVLLTSGTPGLTGPGLATGSPFMGAILPGIVITENGMRGRDWPEMIFWVILWTGAYGTAAVGLYLAVLASFDRCLGRMTARDDYGTADYVVDPLQGPRNEALLGLAAAVSNRRADR